MIEVTPPARSAARVRVRFERHLAAAAYALVGGHDNARLRILDAARERVRRKSAEHHGMNRADARAGKHRERGLRDHRHIDGDAVALLGAARLEDVGEPAHLGLQLAVSDLAVVLRIIALPDDGDLVAALRHMAVDAIVGDVGDAVLEPFDRDVMRIEGGVLDLGEWLEPIDALGLLAPESVRILDRALVHGGVLFRIDEGALFPIGRNVIDLVTHLPLLGALRVSSTIIMRPGFRAPQAFQCHTLVGTELTKRKSPYAMLHAMLRFIRPRRRRRPWEEK